MTLDSKMFLSKLFTKKNLYSLYYILFEGISRGANYFLLILIASFINNELYVKLMLLVSLEALLNILFISNNSDILYALDNNKKSKYFNCVFDASLIQFLLFITLYFIFKNYINYYYEYNLNILIFCILGNAFLATIIRFYSVTMQIILDHKTALKLKSIPFFISFIFSSIFLLTLNDKILAFFLGKTLGLSLSFGYYFLYKQIKLKIFSTNKFTFISVFKRAKYSFLIAILGWSAGLGFLNFAKVFSNEKNMLILSLILTLSAILQMVGNGINQVYSPQLKTYFLDSYEKAKNYSIKTHKVYFILSTLLIFGATVIYIFSNEVLMYLPKLEVIIVEPYIFMIPILFLISSFNWIAGPFFTILDKFKSSFMMNVMLYIVSWLIIILLITFKVGSVIIYYLILKAVISIGLYIYINRNVKMKHE